MVKKNSSQETPLILSQDQAHSVSQDNGLIPSIAIVVANFYQDIADLLEKGAVEALLDKKMIAKVGGKVEYKVFYVPGALEIPPAISTLSSVANQDGVPIFHGYVALGCVIRGETSHYDIVAEQSAHALMQLSIHDRLPIGNGILTVDNQAQAIERADFNQGNKGRAAVDAALTILSLQMQYEVSSMDVEENPITEHMNILEQMLSINNGDDDDDDDDGFKGQEPN